MLIYKDLCRFNDFIQFRMSSNLVRLVLVDFRHYSHDGIDKPAKTRRVDYIINTMSSNLPVAFWSRFVSFARIEVEKTAKTRRAASRTPETTLYNFEYLQTLRDVFTVTTFSSKRSRARSKFIPTRIRELEEDVAEGSRAKVRTPHTLGT